MLKRLASRWSTRLAPLLMAPLLALMPVMPVQASEIMAIAKDLKPGENGLPPPLEKPLHISVCLFDILGKNGELYNRAKDLVLIARRWNVFTEIQVFTDERITDRKSVV